MKLNTFATLKKLMARTISESDNESLSAMRAANRILATEGIDWERVLSRTVTVINEVEEDPEAPRTAAPVRPVSNVADESLIEEAEQAATHGSSRTQEFVASIREQFDRKGWISDGQRKALRDVRDR